MSLREHARPLSPALDLEQSLRDLMLKSLSGDGSSYNELLEKIAVVLRSRLMKTASRARHSAEQVEDLVQDVLLAIHQKRHTYRAELPLLPWIHTIARYRLIDSIRAQGRKPVITDYEVCLDDFATNEITPGAQRDVESILGELPARQREVLRLAKIEELPLNEVSKRMNMSLSAVKVTVHRAMAALRRSHGMPDADIKDDHEND